MSDSPVSILYDSNGDPIHVVEVNGEQHLGSAVVQDVQYSTSNSSTTNLISEGSFTGTSESLFGLTGIEVFCISDKVLSVTVQQSIDGSNWDIFDSWLSYPGFGDGRGIHVIGKFFRLIVVNISPETTTYLRLQSILSPITDLMPRTLTSSGTVRMVQKTKSLFPDFRNFTDLGELPPLRSDNDGHLSVRGPIITDEGCFRDDFTTTEINVALSGTLSFSNSIYVTGISTNFLSEVTLESYVKLDTDSVFALARVVDVISNTLLVLQEAYTGTVGSGTATVSNWQSIIGNGGSITHISSNVELVSGVTPGGYSILNHSGDYPPYGLFSIAKLSGRLANQDSYIGFMEGQPYSSDKIAAIKFSGTDNTKVQLVTSFDLSDQEITEVTLPGGGVTSDYHQYRLDVATTGVILWVDNVKLAHHIKHIPGPYDYMAIAYGIMNLGVVSATNTFTLDVSCFNNGNRLATSLWPVGENIPVAEYKPLGSSSSSVSAATGDTQLLASSMVRTGATVYNESSSVLYLKLGTGASSSSFTVIVPKNSYYELPYGYRGAVHGAWASATGDARITEVF